ncbi:MAG: hypothetical protein HDT39_16025 [Lachnospiraceae bacterium]|nr:hypothetical protein [Lachnospiraceae bacterium]
MNWKNLFERHILERGYGYYCENAVENLNVSDGIVRADVMGSKDYEVEISLDNGKVTDMYCSCPYATDGRNCKHMAAVLFEWSEGQKYGNELKKNGDTDENLFIKVHTVEAYKKKVNAIQKLVENADIAVVRSYLTSVLAENEKLLVCFNSIVNEQSIEEDIKSYISQVDGIANRYLGRNHFISYYEADGFISELDDILDEGVHRMIAHMQYMRAFELMNYIFTLIGNVDMDDSNGGIGMLAAQIYQLWLELIAKVNQDEKREMFQWFTTHLNGSVIDYLEEYIEQIIMEEFREKEYMKQKMIFVEEMIKKSETMDSDWSRSYNTGKWAARYLSLLELQKCDKKEIEDFCKAHWENSSVRRYYIDLCINSKEYDLALKTLDESIALDSDYRGLVADYSKKKKEIYLLQGDKDAYIKQLWELVLNFEVGNLEVYRELKKQYGKDEWVEKREQIFRQLPQYAHVEELYREERLYDRLLDFVLKTSGLYALQEYEEILKKDYPEQILQKYKDEVNQMASYTGDRKKYQQLVALLRNMQKIKGGSKVVEEIVAEWKVQYRNRPAMMDELRKL